MDGTLLGPDHKVSPRTLRAVKRAQEKGCLLYTSILAYTLSAVPEIGVAGIWAAVPIGWFLADLVGILYYFRRKSRLLGEAAAAGKENILKNEETMV